MEEKKRVGLTDLFLLVVSILYLVLMLTLFRACGAKEDGSFMTCHWAHQTLLVFAGLLIVLSLLHLILGDARRKQGISVAVIAVCFASILIPGHMISLCMMADMRCRKWMVPGNIMLTVVMIAAAALDLFVQMGRAKKMAPPRPPKKP